MRHRIPFGLIILGLIGTTLLAVALVFFNGSRHLRSRFQKAQQTILVQEDIDLSTAGVKSFTFDQQYGNPHGGLLQLDFDLAPTDAYMLHKKLDGLAGSFSVEDALGRDWGKTEFTSRDFSASAEYENPPSPCSLTFREHALPYPPGQYTLTIEVAQPAGALQGIRHTLFVRYHNCEMELLGAKFFSAIAVLMALVSLLILAGVTVRTIRKAKRF